MSANNNREGVTLEEQFAADVEVYDTQWVAQVVRPPITIQGAAEMLEDGTIRPEKPE